MSTATENANQTEQTISREERTRDKMAAATSELSADVASANASAFEEEKAPEETCPKCHTTNPWAESSWCPDCGYYPGISEICPESYQEPITEEQQAAADAEAPLIAPWVLRLIGFNTALIVICIGARYYFTYVDSSFRGLTGLVVLVAGFVTLAINHLRSAMHAMQSNTEIGPFDMFGSPIEMWKATMRGLPETSGRLVWATVGFNGMICGGLVIGGITIGYLSDAFDPPQKKPDVLKKIVNTAVDNAPPEEEQPDSLEEALGPVETLEEAGKIPMPEPGRPITCVVYGFLRDGADDFGRILLAAEIAGKRRHVATMPASAFPKSAREVLAARLEPLVIEQTSVATQYHATWVRPSIGLRIEFSGWSVLGEMLDPTLAPRAAKNEPAPLEPIQQ